MLILECIESVYDDFRCPMILPANLETLDRFNPMESEFLSKEYLVDFIKDRLLAKPKSLKAINEKNLHLLQDARGNLAERLIVSSGNQRQKEERLELEKPPIDKVSEVEARIEQFEQLLDEMEALADELESVL